ncbi:aldehyde dehydrogenase family protein [Mesorhizobium australicum]|uniref:Aldehyde dehydrogenase (NAD+) n=1 Tax=Mesorhizobium australicum TaxID=536018 RepID=A0A1X7PYE9_9HYPH|nr:aldehyde dehydrogenase family protein [Mesorhizobium australicum]SMH56476.1 aldehyde dehydrogenase (NAD+) [Mesorhizobium australicum]
MSDRWNHYIGGTFREPAGGAYLRERNPRTRGFSYEIARGSSEDVRLAVEAARAAYPAWRALRPIARGRVLSAMAAAIRSNLDDLAESESLETGKTAVQAKAEIEVAAQYFEFYASVINLPGGEVIDLGDKYHSYTRREPLGVVGVILPWNGPLNQAARGIAPALGAGNAVVSKPSEFTSVSLLKLARLAVEQCGLPAGLLNVVTGNGPETGEAIVSHPEIRKVAFTGSLRAGREIGRIAAERVIPVTLELGGKSPNVVFADADLDAAALGALRAFISNAGQICSSGTRCLVEASIHDVFVDKLATALDKVSIGRQEPGSIGPMSTEAQFDKVQSYYGIARGEGLVAVRGGALPDAPELKEGWFVLPTIYANVPNSSRLAREEIFGPILSVIPFSDEADAIRIANDTEYGLVAGLWTRDLARAHRVAGQIEAGQVFVNEYFAGGVETPFGGYKQSGIGREKGIEALHHYSQVKSVTIAL